MRWQFLDYIAMNLNDMASIMDLIDHYMMLQVC